MIMKLTPAQAGAITMPRLKSAYPTPASHTGLAPVIQAVSRAVGEENPGQLVGTGQAVMAFEHQHDENGHCREQQPVDPPVNGGHFRLGYQRLETLM